MRHDPAVLRTRAAVRAALRDRPGGSHVAVAVSGGADSLALAAAAAFVAPRVGLAAQAVVVDHGLQPGSAEQAERAAAQCRALGIPAVVRTVAVAPGGGPEAAARRARYAALDAEPADAVLLGHTLDDQAETVLLGLARGSGARSLAGMAPVSGRYRRPFLGVRRTETLAACRALALDPWDDPHNADAAYTRVRVRCEALPALEEAAGPGVAEALARSAELLRADADALDVWAGKALAVASGPDGLDVATLAELPAAVRARVLRQAALLAGAPAGALAAAHVAAIDRLVTAWHGQGPVALPGGVVAARRCDRLAVR